MGSLFDKFDPHKETNFAKQTAKPLQNNLGYTHLKAIYPTITENAFALTMDAYRLFVDEYNLKVFQENIEIDRHNVAVGKNIKENGMNEVQSTYSKIWHKKNKGVKARPRNYNALVDEFCKDYGLCLEKVKIQTIKYASEIIFRQILHSYQVQLSKKAAVHIKFSVAYNSEVPMIDVNAWEISKFQRNGVGAVAVCPKTIRNHRQRLEEAGVLVETTFSGHKHGVKCRINPDILTVFDLKTENLMLPENQRLIRGTRKEFPDNEDNTRTIKNSIKIKENVEINSLDKGVRPEASRAKRFVLQEQPKQETNSTGGGTAESVKVLPENQTLSEKLTAFILHHQELAENLSLGIYNTYTPIDLRILSKEAYDGTMTREEFKNLIIQDFICQAAKIWKDKRVYPGCWKNTINYFVENRFKAFTGTAFNKHILVEMLQEYRWRIDHARKWFISKQFSPLFPIDYFDLKRIEAKEVGFEYTKKAYQKHLKYQEKKELKKRKLEQKTIARKAKIAGAKAVETKIRLYLKGKIELETLFNFVAVNHPDFIANLSQMTYKIQSHGTIQ